MRAGARVISAYLSQNIFAGLWHVILLVLKQAPTCIVFSTSGTRAVPTLREIRMP